MSYSDETGDSLLSKSRPKFSIGSPGDSLSHSPSG
ncbi:unnamed protein product [Soboliphyme baturini]|uniref:SYBU n=1 Tax=Soboliphyme baturini TaxID=241478 RepID=A0A183JB78_9BILA|nr:unnamed protein product [Soboliphyme baturini]